MRALFFAGLFAVGLSTAAIADESVAGDWHADVGDGVVIDMTVTPDGHWTSETHQRDQLVRQMKGNYRQTHAGHDAGTLVFKPTSSSGGKAQTETDRYRLSDNGGTLKLTAQGDTMVFERKH